MPIREPLLGSSEDQGLLLAPRKTFVGITLAALLTVGLRLEGDVNLRLLRRMVVELERLIDLEELRACT